MKINTENNRYKSAVKKIKMQRGFYNHLQIFVIIMLLLLFFSNMIFNFFESHIHNPGTLRWARANVWVNCLLWAIGIGIHGLLVFKNKINFIAVWEKKKITELMNALKK